MNVAKSIKVDEFYTLMADVEAELNHYTPFLKGKTIYCCCDNPQFSNFSKYFISNHKRIGIKKLICSWYQAGESATKWAEYDADSNQYIYHIMNGDGNFESEACISLFQLADVIVTNPPFSRSQSFLEFLLKNNKRFIIVCNRNTIITKKYFPIL